MVGPTSQQDVELSALYRDAVITYGEGKVLGILATRANDHEIRKRAVPDEPTQETPATKQTTIETKKSNLTSFVYYLDTPTYKILLYTSEPPKLFDGNTTTLLNDDVPTTITSNTLNKNEVRTLKVRYNYPVYKVSFDKNVIFPFEQKTD